MMQHRRRITTRDSVAWLCRQADRSHNLCVVGVEMRMQTMMLHQLQKISGIEKKED